MAMPIYFLDSSALVKAYRQETGTPRVLALFTGVDPLVIARLAHAEVSSAIVRRGRAAGMASATIDAVLAELDREIINKLFDVIELSPTILTRAVQMTRIHALRAADAIQLACALSARDQTPQQLITMVGSDLELNSAALAEGLAILDPTQP